MKRNAIIAAILGVSILSMGFLGFGDKDKKTIAKVGKTAITIDDLNFRIANFPPNYQQALQQKENPMAVLDQFKKLNPGELNTYLALYFSSRTLICLSPRNEHVVSTHIL